MTPRYANGVSEDLNRLTAWYHRQRAGLGRVVAAEFTAALGRITSYPHAYGRVPRSPHGREVREMVIDRFPIRVVYEVFPTEVLILSVTDARRRSQPWRSRLP